MTSSMLQAPHQSSIGRRRLHYMNTPLTSANKWSNKLFYLFSIPLLLYSCVLAFASM
ncbi:hypothetical protein [Paenibacillus profundus]|uniref:hypothetical protein n=1 Tax=Paenibacillus profundus TaxID=1173085 RepID=UPI001F259B5B|nr:hypothetical protein [Paenibacillus profundus]